MNNLEQLRKLHEEVNEARENRHAVQIKHVPMTRTEARIWSMLRSDLGPLLAIAGTARKIVPWLEHTDGPYLRDLKIDLKPLIEESEEANGE